MVASAGNDGGEGCLAGSGSVDRWPAKFPTVIAVGASDRAGQPWACSPDKDYVDVLAPGYQLLMADVAGGYFVESGTSAATPLVAGLIAVILAERPDLTPADIRRLLAGATAQHQRLVPSALLAELGLLVHEPPLDLTSLREVLPYTVHLTFSQDHPIQVPINVVDDLRVEYSRERPTRLRGIDGQDPDVYLSGLLLVGDDGTVSGWAATRVTPLGPINYCAGAVCGSTPAYYTLWCSVGDPAQGRLLLLNFDWQLRGPVTGRLDRSGESGEHRLELSFSLGLGATPDQPGDLPGIMIFDDTLDGCPASLDGWNQDPLNAPLSMDRVEEARNRYVAEVEAFYRHILAAMPYHLTATFDPQAVIAQGSVTVDTVAGPDPTAWLTVGEAAAPRPQVPPN